MQRPGFADQRKLAAWADSTTAKPEFPRLIRRLILETTPGAVDVGMATSEGTSSGGWDGVVRSMEATAFVPEGLSVWELSVSRSVGTKADEDYEKRLATPDGSPTEECVYVEAILRRWTKRDEWAKNRSADGRWKEVRAYGLDKIDSWLETAPVTWAWFSELIGLNPFGLQSAEAWWNSWVAQTDPPITADILLAGRSDSSEAVLRRLESAQVTTLAGASEVEVCAFLTALAVRADTEGKGRHLARLAFVDDLSTWRALMETKSPLILVPRLEGLAEEIPANCAHHIVIPVQAKQQADVVLEPLDAAGVARALQEAGVDEKRAGLAGRLARRSLMALRRHLAIRPALHIPRWAKPPSSRVVRAALLIGSWADEAEGDRSVVSELSGQDYESFKNDVAALALTDDPFLTRVASSWHLVSPFDAWLLLRDHVTQDDLKRFKEAVDEVLGEEDPALDLDPDDRWKAQIEGKVRKYSSELRAGLDSTVALLGVHGEHVTGPGGSTGVQWAEYLVRERLTAANGDSSGRKWASLSNSLPALAEGGPIAFIEGVRSGLAGDAPVLRKMFIDTPVGSDLFAPHSPHTDLLWALERLAWGDEYFGAAVDLLARLDAIDPAGSHAEKKDRAGSLGNRPFESLKRIFCPWHPENTVSPERRLEVLDGLRTRQPDTAWRLILSMLPEFHGIHSPTSEPAFRDWKPLEEKGVTNVEYFPFITEVVKRCLADAGKSQKRWRALVRRFSDLPPEDRSLVASELEALVGSGAFNTDEDDSLWQAIREVVGRHTEYADAAWALPEEEIKKLGEISSWLAPKSRYNEGAWLFNEYMPHLGDKNRRDDHPEYDRLLAERRRDALALIEEEGGLKAVHRLAEESELSWTVGLALADSTGSKYEGELLADLDQNRGPKLEMARTFFSKRFLDGGWDWLTALLEGNELSSLQKARLLLSTSQWPKAWEEATALGKEVEQEFWRAFSPYGLGHDFSWVKFVAERLIAVGRNAIALDFLGMYSHTHEESVAEDPEFAGLSVQALQGLLNADADEEMRALSQYDFERIFQQLERHRENVGEDVVASLEWAYLPALGFEPDVPTLDRRMATDPEFFVQVLSAAYKARSGQDESDDDEEADEEEQMNEEELEAQRSRATNAFHLLSSWRTCPGLVEGRIDPDSLKTWMGNAKEALQKAERYKIGLVYIGHVFYYAPADDDGAWPPAAIRDILEDLQSDQLDDGLETKIYNSRGVTSRGLEEGGKQEIKLAEEYKASADRFRDRWPRTATLLDQVARSYENEARRNEASAERFRQGYGL